MNHSQQLNCDYDEAGSIGKRYRREDIMGTPWCLTVDDNTLENDVVTLRNRDTMEQISLTVDEAIKYVQDRIKF